MQSFILTEVSDCGLLIVITSSTFLKRKDKLKEKSSSSKISSRKGLVDSHRYHNQDNMHRHHTWQETGRGAVLVGRVQTVSGRVRDSVY